MTNNHWGPQFVKGTIGRDRPRKRGLAGDARLLYIDGKPESPRNLHSTAAWREVNEESCGDFWGCIVSMLEEETYYVTAFHWFIEYRVCRDVCVWVCRGCVGVFFYLDFFDVCLRWWFKWYVWENKCNVKATSCVALGLVYCITCTDLFYSTRDVRNERFVSRIFLKCLLMYMAFLSSKSLKVFWLTRYAFSLISDREGEDLMSGRVTWPVIL